MNVIRHTDSDFAAQLRRVTEATHLFDKTVEERTRSILEAVYARGDAAVVELTEKFDGARLLPDQLAVTQAEFIEAFYTTPVFRLERLILRWTVSKPSTDDEARALATGHADSFAAWKVEARTGDQLLLCDFLGRTRSWLMAEPIETTGPARTRLHFGSAVIPRGTTRHGQAPLEFRFRALLGFHKLYSRVLVSSARARLTRQRP